MNENDLHYHFNELAKHANLFDTRFGQYVSVLEGGEKYYAVVNSRALLALPGVGKTTLHKFVDFLRRGEWEVYSTI
jgi:hypothetical protein